MTRITLLCTLLVLLTVGRSLPAANAPPNVVLLISDDQAWTDYGFMGHEHIKTPHLDRLASQSMTFRRGYVPTSLCRPSLVSIITGQYPHQHGVTGNDPIPKKPADRENMLQHIRATKSLPQWLAKKNYLSFQTGKWWEGAPAEAGFTSAMTHGDPRRGGRHGDLGLKIGRDGMLPIREFLTDAQQAKQPFFLWYAPFLPHTPHNPPAKYRAKYADIDAPEKLKTYYAMCEWFDDTCGELLNELEQRGLAENTLVVYVTDNGWTQRTELTELPEGWRQPFAPRSKRAPHDAGLRTPIMYRWPGVIEPGESNELTSSIDIAPTVLAACGLDVPSDLPGVNLFPFLTGEEQYSRPQVFGEIFTHDVVDQNDPSESLLYRWTVKGDWKLIQPAEIGDQLRQLPKSLYRFDRPEGQQVELYNVSKDPGETKNLAETHPDKVRELQADLDEWYPVGD